MNPYYPVERCPICDTARPWRDRCRICGDPGGMPRTLPETHKSWTASERALYAGAAIRVMGEQDKAGRFLVQVMSGELNGEFRWFTDAELFGNAAQTPQDAPEGDEGPQSEESDVYVQPEPSAAKNGEAAA